MVSEPARPQPEDAQAEVPQAARAPLATAARAPTPPRRRRKQLLALGVGLLLLYLLAAYVLLPLAWRGYTHRHPSLADIPDLTHTGSGIPADPLNVALIGTRTEILRILIAARWYPADPLTFRSCLAIAEATVLKRPYDAAPVSSLYLFGRKEDLAFEQPVGKDPRRRHHVRFWRAPKEDPDGRPVWVGAAVYDEKVGFSRRTGQVTHVTAPNVDAERDYLFADLRHTGELAEVYIEEDFHSTLQGKNGGGDPWYTDGNLYVGVIQLSGALVGPEIAAPKQAR